MSRLTLEDALQAAEAARQHAVELGVAVSVAVVDEGGRQLLVMRGDDLGFMTPDFALAKATGAAGFKVPTAALAERWEGLPAFWTASLHAAPSPYIPAPGGVPIRRNGRLVGAIGCGGARPDQDHACAEAGAAALD